MELEKVSVQGREFSLEILVADTTSRERLDAGAAEVVQLFLAREKSFGFGSDVVVDYPDTGPGGLFLNDPVTYVEARRTAATAEGAPYGRIVILTTYADRIGRPLADLGWIALSIDMPAGPDNTCAFVYDVPGFTGAGRHLYVEAVNEADEKIRPTFVLRLLDEARQLQGGACGAIHKRDGRRYAYLGTMAVASGLPPTTGTRLAEAMLDLLRGESVSTVHLGTQTAGPFYEKLGFDTTHRLVCNLRNRVTEAGRSVDYDLVMMSLELKPR